jgi:hypothetical protein
MIEERRIQKTDPSELRSRLASEYKDAKRFADSTAARADELKKFLISEVKGYGTADDKGHLWAPAGDFQLKYERRASTGFDIAAATQWAKENGYWDEVKEVVEVANEEKFLSLGWTNPEAGEQIQRFYTTKETWAFKLVEQRSYDDE